MIDPPSPPIDPYAPPKAVIAPGGSANLDDAEQIRNEFLKHETSVRSVGLLYLVSGWLAAFGTVILLLVAVIAMTSVGEAAGNSAFGLGLGLFYAAIAAVSIYIGRGLRRLDPSVRLATTILLVLGLLAVPFGTLINGYFLYLIHGAKGKRVLTPEYQEIVAQTPHIKYKTPLWLILLAILLVALVAFGIFFAMQTV